MIESLKINQKLYPYISDKVFCTSLSNNIRINMESVEPVSGEGRQRKYSHVKGPGAEFEGQTMVARKHSQTKDPADSGLTGRKYSHAREPTDPLGPMVTGPTLRRISKLEPRTSLQMGYSSRRPSQASRRTSVSYSSQGTKQLIIPIKLQNTYRIKPQNKFNSNSVEKIMKGVLESYLDGEVYEPKMCANLAQNLSEVIKSRVKDLGFMRYKLVCNVIIGENSDQDMRMVSRCLWNAETDSYAEAHYSKGKLYAVASVYATYFE